MSEIASKKYDPVCSLAAYNMAAALIYKISSSHDVMLFNLEEFNTGENFRYELFDAEPEVAGLFREIHHTLSEIKLEYKDLDLYENNHNTKTKKGLAETVVKNMGMAFHTDIFWWLGKLAMSTLSEYFSAVTQTDPASLRLEAQKNFSKDLLKKIQGLKERLLEVAGTLKKKYSFKDSDYLSLDKLEFFYAALKENNPVNRFNMLEYLEESFQMYAPYWFYLGDAASRVNKEEIAGKSFDKFYEVWRPVLKQDPYKVEVLKLQINELSKSLNSPKEKALIKNYLAEMKKNIQSKDWVNHIYLGMAYYAIGDIAAARKAIKLNITFQVEEEISKKILDKIESQAPFQEILEIFTDTRDTSPQPVQPVESKDKTPKTFSLKNIAMIFAFVGFALALLFIRDLRNSNAKSQKAPASAPVQEAKPAPSPEPEPAPVTPEQTQEPIQILSGTPQEQNELGRAFYFEEDYDLALNYFAASALQGYAPAQNNLAYMYYSGKGQDKKDFKSALHWYTQAADQDYPEAQYNLGIIYAKGFGVSRDLEKAVALWELAAEQDNDDAQYQLGDVYLIGKLDGKKNYQLALEYYELAAEKNNSSALNNLAYMYSNGLGLSERDEQRAFELYAHAAELGNRTAQKNLAVFYEQGLGTQSDLEQAYTWYFISELSGNKSAQKKLDALSEKIPGLKLILLRDDAKKKFAAIQEARSPKEDTLIRGIY